MQEKVKDYWKDVKSKVTCAANLEVHPMQGSYNIPVIQFMEIKELASVNITKKFVSYL